MLQSIYPDWFLQKLRSRYGGILPNINPKSKYVIVMVETREIPEIELIVQNHFDFFSQSILEPCAVEIFCSEKMSHYYRNKLGDGVVCNLIDEGFDYNNLLTSPIFWDSLRQRDYKKVLIFQWDSLLLRDERKDIIDGYAYIGAPWNKNHIDIRGGNGGLSIRDVEVMYKVTREVCYSKSLYGNEDVFFSKMVKDEYKLSNEDASEVFVEQIFKPYPFGIHAAHKWQHRDIFEGILHNSII